MVLNGNLGIIYILRGEMREENMQAERRTRLSICIVVQDSGRCK